MNNTFDRLTLVVNNMLKKNYFPGANYSLVTNNSCLCGSVGNKSIIPNIEKNNVDTIYDIASLTKVIVTNTILTRALQDNKLSLSDDIGDYLPQYKYLGVTIYDLVTHSSGLPADFDTSIIHSNADFVKQLSDIHKVYKTGSTVIYSDKNFILLGMILEKIYSKTIDEIAKEEIFIPLHMYHSTFYPDKDLCAPTEYTSERGIVRGKTHDEKSYYSDKILGHAGLFSTIEDISKFSQMVLNDGMIDGKQYISKKYIDLWFTPVVHDKEDIYRSIGWIVGQTKNVTGDKVSNQTISHTGFTGTSIVIDRGNNISVILLSNRIHPTRDNKLLISNRHLLMDEVINKHLTLNNNNAKI